MRVGLVSKDAAKVHLKSLSDQDRYTRFCTNIKDDQIDKYVDSAKGVFYGVFCVGDNWVDRCVCLMHFVPDHKSKEAEIALSTLPDYRGNGYAKKLLTGGIFMANAYLMEKVVMSGLSSNKAIVVLAKSCGLEVEHECGEFMGERGTAVSLFNTLAENNIKMFKILCWNS